MAASRASAKHHRIPADVDSDEDNAEGCAYGVQTRFKITMIRGIIMGITASAAVALVVLWNYMNIVTAASAAVLEERIKTLQTESEKLGSLYHVPESEHTALMKQVRESSTRLDTLSRELSATVATLAEVKSSQTALRQGQQAMQDSQARIEMLLHQLTTRREGGG